LFSSLKVEKNLFADVFGESVFNDAIAIVIYRSITNFAFETVTGANIFLAVINFFVIFFGSMIIGIVVALIASLVFKNINFHNPIAELVLLIIFALISYTIADGIKQSGIVSILFCGIAMSHYAYNCLSPEAKLLSKKMFQVLGNLSENFVFIYLGLAIFAFDPLKQEYDIGLITMSIPIILIARAANIFPLSMIINMTRPKKHRINCNSQIMLWFAGLRGAIAFTLALDVPTPAKSELFSTTVIIILFTVLIFGGVTVPILKALNIKMGGKEEDGEEEKEFSTTNRFLLFDRKYIKPIFSKKYNDDSHDQQEQQHHKKRKAKEDEDIEMRENVGRDKKSDEEPIEKIILVEDEEIKEGDEIKF